MGVSALTAGTISCILQHYPSAEIVLLDYGKKRLIFNFEMHNRIVSVPLINMRFSKKIYLKNNIVVLLLLSVLLKFIPSQKIKIRLISNNFYLDNIYNSDIIAAIAGGDSFSDIYGVGRFFYVSLPQLLIILLGKPLVLLPQTIGPFEGCITKGMAKYLMNRVKVIYSRDKIGVQETKDLLGLSDKINKKIKFCYDIGFVVNPVRPKKIDSETFYLQTMDNHRTVGLNVSGLLFVGGYAHNNMFGLKLDYKELMYEVIDYLIDKKNVSVLLIPHVFRAPTDPNNDSVACEHIYNSLKSKYADKLFCVFGEYNQNEIKYIIGLCDFFIGSRMHACIAALSQNIPSVSIAYSKKFLGVMETIGVESLVADPRKLGKEEIIEVIDQAYEQRDIIKKHLEKTMPNVKETVLNLFHEIDIFLQ